MVLLTTATLGLCRLCVSFCALYEIKNEGVEQNVCWSCPNSHNNVHVHVVEISNLDACNFRWIYCTYTYLKIDIRTYVL